MTEQGVLFETQILNSCCMTEEEHLTLKPALCSPNLGVPLEPLIQIKEPNIP